MRRISRSAGSKLHFIDSIHLISRSVFNWHCKHKPTGIDKSERGPQRERRRFGPFPRATLFHQEGETLAVAAIFFSTRLVLLSDAGEIRANELRLPGYNSVIAVIRPSRAHEYTWPASAAILLVVNILEALPVRKYSCFPAPS